MSDFHPQVDSIEAGDREVQGALYSEEEIRAVLQREKAETIIVSHVATTQLA